jgi:predicted DNA-binding mobile mystery protein A
MKTKFSRIKMRQMDEKIRPWRALRNSPRPSQGWIKALREALGMTTTELAKRLKMSQPGVTFLEESEAANKITLETLSKAANALDSVLVYAVVPRQEIEKSVRDQARHLANEMIGRTSHSMNLEAQGLSEEKTKVQAEELAAELLAKRPRPFWK